MPYIGNVTTDFNVGTDNINNGAVTGEKLSLPFDYDSGTLYLDPTNNRVGIGTTSPNYILDVNAIGFSVGAAFATDQAETWLFLKDSGTTLGHVRIGVASNNIIFRNSNTERARIDSSGRLLVGTSTSTSTGPAQAALQVASTTRGVLSGAYYGNDALPATVIFGKSRGTSAGSFTSVIADDSLGQIIFAGADGTDLVSQAAAINCQVDGTPGANDMPGRLVFSTTADGASTPTERMRIDSSGRLGLGTSSPSTLLHVNTFNEATAITVAASNATGGQLLLGIGNKSANTQAIVSTGNGLDIGTTLGNPITFFTNGTANERARIDGSGRLLVGTSTSTSDALLQISGNTRTTGNYYGKRFFASLTAAADAGTVSITFTLDATASTWGMRFNLYVDGGFNTGNRRGSAEYVFYATSHGTGDTISTALSPTGNLGVSNVRIVSRSATSLVVAFDKLSGANYGFAVDGSTTNASLGNSFVNAITASLA